LYKFEGNLEFCPDDEEIAEEEKKEIDKQSQEGLSIPLDANQFLLRGSSLRNTDYIYGVVVYTGHDSKIMKNSPNCRNKLSKIEKKTNKLIIYALLIEIVIVAFATAIQITWNRQNRDSTDFYLGWSLSEKARVSSLFLDIIIGVGTWILMFSDFVPISLLVTLEFIKFFQALFMTYDSYIFDETKDMYAKVQSSNLTEELGQIEYIFSDKTGTLTQNVMEFNKMCIGSNSYGKSEPENFNNYSDTTSADQKEDQKMSSSDKESSKSRSRKNTENSEEPQDPDITNVKFNDPTFKEHMNDKENENYDRIHKFLIHLALCHTVIIDKHEVDGRTKISYNASSPDELALVNGARFFGYFFKDRDEDDNMIIEHPEGGEEKYTLLNVIEFDSDRKRMSVIVKLPDDRIKMFVKGADSVIFERLKNDDYVEETKKYLSEYASSGLRTLLLAEKEISEQEYEEWADHYNKAALSTNNREEAIAKVAEEIENDFELIGATAIEDKLQDDVANTISALKKAGIKIWVLTGDKIETAINIGYSCHVLSDDMCQHVIDGESSSKIEKQLDKAIKDYTHKSSNSHALIIGGDSLTKVTVKENILEKFIELAEGMTVVLACRVSPKQKAEVVKFIKDKYPMTTTLAIGDGANDVNMITSADVGVGISGLEGQQATRASDFAIGQFKHLKVLLLFHGRESYRKIAYTVGYMFYKNIISIM